MLQSATNDLFNPLVPKAHNSECQNLLFPLQIKSVKWVKATVSWVCTFGSNGLSKVNNELGATNS